MVWPVSRFSQSDKRVIGVLARIVVLSMAVGSPVRLGL